MVPVLTWLCAAALFAAAWNPGPGWESGLEPIPEGAATEPESLALEYRFSWSGIRAADARIEFEVGKKFCVARVEAATVGMARSLWQYDLNHEARCSKSRLLPVRFLHRETLRGKTVRYNVEFTEKGVAADKALTTSGETRKTRRSFRNPPMAWDLLSAYLNLRSLEWPVGRSAEVVLFPVFAPYLIRIEAMGEERLEVAAGKFSAIRYQIEVRRIGKKRKLERFTKLKSATVWLSADSRRLVLKADAEIFVGRIEAELRSVR